jgi:hypothetical protein
MKILSLAKLVFLINQGFITKIDLPNQPKKVKVSRNSVIMYQNNTKFYNQLKLNNTFCPENYQQKQFYSYFEYGKIPSR